MSVGMESYIENGRVVHFSYMTNMFQDLLAQGKALFAKVGSSHAGGVVGVDIGTSSIKMVQAKEEKGAIVLETYGELALGPYAEGEPSGKITNLPPEKIIAAMKDLMQQANITAKRAYFSLSAQSSLVFTLQLPGEVSDKDLEQVVPNEARKFIPVPLSEVSLDWFVIPRKETYADEAGATANERKQTELLIVAIRNEILEKYQAIQKGCGLDVAGLELEVFSTIRSVFQRQLTPVLLVDIGASSTRIAVVEYGVVRSFHVTNRGGAFLTDSLMRTQNITFEKAEELKREIGTSDVGEHKQASVELEALMSVIVSEIKNVISEYERQYNKAITQITLVGGGSLLKGFRDRVLAEFKIETVYGDPFIKTEAPEFLRPVLKDAGPSFAVALGSALKELL